MIKVGQIYNCKILGGKIVITWIAANWTQYHMIRNDGFTFYSIGSSRDDEDELIAEYPTWQEAVNSKEFNADNC